MSERLGSDAYQRIDLARVLERIAKRQCRRVPFGCRMDAREPRLLRSDPSGMKIKQTALEACIHRHPRVMRRLP